jgi:hypothetical protein
MTLKSFAFAAALVATLSAQAAPAGDDTYGYRQQTAAMADKDGMVSQQDLIALIEKTIEQKAQAMGVRNGKLTRAQLRELEKTLGRMLGADTQN